MKKLTWFTHTNIDTRITSRSTVFSGEDNPAVSWDLSEFIEVFKENKIWNKSKYRTEYRSEYNEEDIVKIYSVKIHLHSEGESYSNTHNYEKVLKKYINLDNYEQSKISSSGISEASQIAVIEVEFNSENKVIDYLNYEEEKDIDTVFEKKLSSENHDSWLELKRIKSIVCEFIQFFNYNLHLNFLTGDYEFSVTEKPSLIGFTTVTEDNFYYLKQIK